MKKQFPIFDKGYFLTILSSDNCEVPPFLVVIEESELTILSSEKLTQTFSALLEKNLN